MKIFFLFAAFFSQGFFAYAQTVKSSLNYSQKHGIIVFEGTNSYELYFVETSSCKSLMSVFEKKDTVNAIRLGSPGDAVNDIAGFKWYLEKKGLSFDSVNLLIADTNYLGYGYEDSTKFYSKFGIIQFAESKASKMNLHYKRIYLNGGSITIVSEYFIPIESFIELPSSGSKKREK